MEAIISQKTDLMMVLSKQQGELLSNDEKIQIIENYEDLMNIIGEVNSVPNENIFEFLFSYKSDIHSSILYKEEASINIDDFNLKNSFGEYYYLDLLIMEDEEIAYYEYSFDFVNNYYNILKLINSKKEGRFQKIVNSKILLDIVNNFCGLDNYDEDINGKDIDNIKNEINEIISNNIDFLKELNLDINEDYFKSRKLDKIYEEIIISLIKNNKFTDYNYVYRIMDEMALAEIRIGMTMLGSLQETLDKNKDYMIPYLIQSKDDLYLESKINFYYILFKYILKSQIFIYQFPFLIETRNIILNMIKLHRISYDNLNQEILVRLKYILETFADSEHYFENKEEVKEEVIKLKEILNYYEHYCFESKKEDIERIKEHIKTQNVKSEYLNEYEKAVEYNNFYPIIKELYYTHNNKKEIDSEKNLIENQKKWESIYNSIKNGKFQKLKKKDILYQYISDEGNKDIVEKIFTKKEIESFVNHIKETKKDKKSQKEKKDLDQTMEAAAPIIPNNNLNKGIIENPYEKKSKIEIKDEKTNKIDKDDNFSIFQYTPNDRIEPVFVEPPVKINGNTPKEPLFDKIVNNITFDDNYLELGEQILNLCCINFSLKKKDDKQELIMDEITTDNNDLGIPLVKFEEYISTSLNLEHENNIIAKNSYKLVKFIKEFQKRIIEEFTNNYLLKLQLKLINTKQTINESFYNIEAIYTFYEPITNNKFTYREENVLENGMESNLQGFNFMMMDINQDKYDLSKNKDNNIFNKSFIDKKEINGINDKEKSFTNSSFSEAFDIHRKASDIKIIEIIKVIENKSSFNGFIYELNNGYIVYVKSDNSLQLIDNKYNPIREIKDYRDKLLSFCDSGKKEKKKDNEDKKDQIVLCSNKSLFLTTINFQTMESETKELNISHLLGFNSIEMKKNNYIVVGKRCTSYFTDLFLENSKKEPKEFQLFDDKSCFNSIKINDNVIALVSNNIFPNGENALLFYNLKKKKLLMNEIKGYSFIMSQNGLELMPILSNDNKKRILLCACKRYIPGQKNGILLVNPNLGENKEVEEPFYDTVNFEVNCFCPLFNVKEKDEKVDIIREGFIGEINASEDRGKDFENLIFEETNYFLVGGFDEDRREGRIRLYKTIYGEKAYNTKIEYIQDIRFKKQRGIEDFNGPINYLLQSRTTGNILASCTNGNIYLLTPPNLNYYLEEN